MLKKAFEWINEAGSNPIIMAATCDLNGIWRGKRIPVTQVEKKQSIIQGQRIGMIRFGSRVDVYYNQRKTMVKVGQNVIAGESLIASS